MQVQNLQRRKESHGQAGTHWRGLELLSTEFLLFWGEASTRIKKKQLWQNTYNSSTHIIQD